VRAKLELVSRAATLMTLAAWTSPVVAGAPGTSDAYSVVYGARVKQATPTSSALAIRIGRPDTLEALVERLLRVAEEFVGRPAGLKRPQVTLIEAQQLRLKLCGGPCTVRAAYVPGEGLFLDREMRPDVNAFHQSILFHELVHHVQVSYGMHQELGGCNVRQVRESQAYMLQNRFLGALGEPRRVIDPAIPCASGERAAQTFHSDTH
jgi:hypothetical protein